jgi:membrane-bound ClpP family serine protease
MPNPYMGRYSTGIIGLLLLVLGYLIQDNQGGFYRGVPVSKWVGIPIFLYGALLIVFQLYKLIKQRRRQ